MYTHKCMASTNSAELALKWLELFLQSQLFRVFRSGFLLSLQLSGCPRHLTGASLASSRQSYVNVFTPTQQS